MDHLYAFGLVGTFTQVKHASVLLQLPFAPHLRHVSGKLLALGSCQWGLWLLGEQQAAETTPSRNLGVQVSEALQVSHTRVWQIKARAMKRLRTCKAVVGLEAFQSVAYGVA